MEGLKIVISHIGETNLIGIMAPNCDPVFTKVEGDLTAALAKMPELVTEAEAKWAQNPKNPKSELPTAPSTYVPPTAGGKATKKAAATKPVKKDPNQPEPLF